MVELGCVEERVPDEGRLMLPAGSVAADPWLVGTETVDAERELLPKGSIGVDSPEGSGVAGPWLVGTEMLDAERELLLGRSIGRDPWLVGTEMVDAERGLLAVAEAPDAGVEARLRDERADAKSVPVEALVVDAQSQSVVKEVVMYVRQRNSGAGLKARGPTSWAVVPTANMHKRLRKEGRPMVRKGRASQRSDWRSWTGLGRHDDGLYGSRGRPICRRCRRVVGDCVCRSYHGLGVFCIPGIDAPTQAGPLYRRPNIVVGRDIAFLAGRGEGGEELEVRGASRRRQPNEWLECAM